MNSVLKIITAKNLTYSQKVVQLSRVGENCVDVLNVSEKFKEYHKKGILCDMNEGNAPFRPRYVMVDFDRFVKQGSKFLRIAPPQDLEELLNSLMILYRHIPSITTFPVYIGNIDTLINPFLDNVSDEKALKHIKLFLDFIDRTIADGYCHANIGPIDTRAGRLILKAQKELQNACPNLTLKYDANITSDEFAKLALECSLICANPAICNHQMNVNTYHDYGISSCYNILPIRGGAYTLTRVVLARLAKEATSVEHFLKELLPDALETLGVHTNERIRFLVEESGYFESSFLQKEGLIDSRNFVAMFGLAGMCECVNTLLKDTSERYGHSKKADDLAEEIIMMFAEFEKNYVALHSEISNHRFMLHAQAGLSTDALVTPGIRITVGDEPENILDHIKHSARYHKYFKTGCADHFPFESTTNLTAILDIVKGAFKLGDRYISFYESNSDLVRITGYLAKRSEIEKFDNGETVLHDTVENGSNNYKLNRLAKRKVRS